jgi:Putative restriction endonuclease
MHAILPVMLPPATVSIRYPVRPSLEAWVLPEGTVPEAPIHDEVAEALKLLLRAWAARSPGSVRIARNLAIRWLEDHPTTGIDPDVCVLAPPPEDLDDFGSLCLWKPGHVAPTLCFEIVSKNHPHKEYVAIQDRYAAMGTRELIVFDPLLAGPKSLGGPVSLQLWRRDASGAFERVHFGAAPVYSEALDAWVIADGRALFIAEDRAGKRRWLNEAEHNKLEAEHNKLEAEHNKLEAEHNKLEADRAKAEAKRVQAIADDAEAAATSANAAVATAKTAVATAEAIAEQARADAELQREAREALEREIQALKAKLGGA